MTPKSLMLNPSFSNYYPILCVQFKFKKMSNNVLIINIFSDKSECESDTCVKGAAIQIENNNKKKNKQNITITQSINKKI